VTCAVPRTGVTSVLSSLGNFFRHLGSGAKRPWQTPSAVSSHSGAEQEFLNPERSPLDGSPVAPSCASKRRMRPIRRTVSKPLTPITNADGYLTWPGNPPPAARIVGSVAQRHPAGPSRDRWTAQRDPMWAKQPHLTQTNRRSQGNRQRLLFSERRGNMLRWAADRRPCVTNTGLRAPSASEFPLRFAQLIRPPCYGFRLHRGNAPFSRLIRQSLLVNVPSAPLPAHFLAGFTCFRVSRPGLRRFGTPRPDGLFSRLRKPKAPVVSQRYEGK